MNLIDIRKLKLGWKKKFIVGRGESSGYGKTCGKGSEGQNTRSGTSYIPYFEGGQMPLPRKIPKRGFNNNRFKIYYQIVNVKTLDARFQDSENVSTESLVERGIIKKGPVKILGHGTIAKKLNVVADLFSKSAAEKITQAGGTCKNVQKTESNPFVKISLTQIQKKFQEKDKVTPEKLVEAKIVKDLSRPIKITGGFLNKKVVVSAHSFSRSAIKKIRSKNGKAIVLQMTS